MARSHLVLLAAVGISMCWVCESDAQRRRPRRRPRVDINVDQSRNSRHDVEGTIWEYKVIDSKSKDTEDTGQIRVKGTAVFAVSSGNDKPLRNAARQKQATTDTDRIGDLDYDKQKEMKISFDKDDDHALSGTAVVKYDLDADNGTWVGYYSDENKKRWRFELRRVED